MPACHHHRPPLLTAVAWACLALVTAGAAESGSSPGGEPPRSGTADGSSGSGGGSDPAAKEGSSAGAAAGGSSGSSPGAAPDRSVPDAVLRTLRDRAEGQPIRNLARVEGGSGPLWWAEIGNREIWVDDQGNFVSAREGRPLPDDHPAERRDRGIVDIEPDVIVVDPPLAVPDVDVDAGAIDVDDPDDADDYDAAPR